MVPSGNCTSSHITNKSLTSNSYLDSSYRTEMTHRIMYYFALIYFLSHVYDFGRGWGLCVGRDVFCLLLFFDLQRDNVSENLFGVGDQLQFAGVDWEISGAKILVQHQTAYVGFKLAGNITG